MASTLRTKWLLSYILLILVTTAVLDIIVSNSLRNYLSHQIQKNLESNLILIKELLIRNPENLSPDQLAKDLGKKLDARVTIINLDGIVLGDTDVPADQIKDMENHKTRPEVIQAYSGYTGQSIRYSHTLSSDMMYVAIPWNDGSKNLGVIRLSLPLILVDQRISETRRWVYGGSVISVFIAILIGIYFSNSITRPIRKMITAAQQISQEKFTQTIRVDTHDELEILAESLNTMSSKLESRFREIEEEKTQLETILSSMTEGVMVLDKKGKIIVTNSAFCKIFHIEDNPVGRTPLELIRNPDVAQALTDGLTREDAFQKEINLPGPGTQVIRLYAAPLMEKEGIAGLVTVFHDITDLRALEQVRRDFVANVSHELRTPLTGIQGFSETLLNGALEDNKHSRKFVENIHTQTNRMTELVEDLLTLSRIESGKAEMKFVEFNLGEAIESAMDLISSKASLQNIKIHLDISKNAVLISGDKRYMEQALVNLLDNAIKFSPRGEIVTISVQELVKQIMIRVSDVGIGIPSEHLSRIFERFYRVDKSRSAETKGTGLGLSIVKHIVDAHRGTVQVESILGKGTTFILTMPKP